MPNIFYEIDPDNGHVFVQTTWYDMPGVTSALLMRVYDSVSTPPTVVANWQQANRGDYPPGLVRPNTITDPENGWEILLNDNWGFWYDTEAPLDTPFSYFVWNLDANFGAQTSVLNVPSSNRFWLRNPVRPADDTSITNSATAPDCVPLSGVYFSSMADEARKANSVEQDVDDSPYGFVSVRARQGIASTLTLVTRTFQDRDDLVSMVENGEPLFFQGPAQYGIDDTYMNVGDFNAARGLSDHRRQWRVATMPFTTVLRPTALQYGVNGTRWEDACSVYGTYLQLDNANLTTQEAVSGLLGSQPPQFQTWATVLSRYGIWGSVLNAQQSITTVDGTFESGLAGWFASNGALVQSSAQHHSGSFSAQLTTSGGSTSQSTVRQAAVTPAVAGMSYTAMTWAYSVAGYSGGSGVHAAIDWYNASGGYLSTSAGPSAALPAATWTQYAAVGTAPAGAAFLAFGPTVDLPPNGTVIWIDDLTLSVDTGTDNTWQQIKEG